VVGVSGERVRLERLIFADPTSTALLLAGPSALDLWPGARRVGTEPGEMQAEVSLPDGQVHALRIRALPPARTPTSYVTRFGVTIEGETSVGQLTLSYAGTVTCAQLDVEVPLAGLRAHAEQFLVNLARTAEQRSDAA
jgi:hypothetical protein